MDLLIVRELLHLTAAVSKALTSPGNNLLLVGCAGVGRKSSVRIVSAYQLAKLITPCNIKQFNSDLKLVSKTKINIHIIFLLLAQSPGHS